MFEQTLKNLADIQEKDRYHVALANPPFDGKESAEVQQNLMIKTDKYDINDLKNSFDSIENFKTSDIVLFFRNNEPKLSQNAINWRIYNLVQKGILERIGKGVFRLGQNRLYIPEISSKQKNIYNAMFSKFPFSKFCVWNLSILNEFSIHQSDMNFILLEVEKESVQSVFYEMKENKNNVFIEPTEDVIENYVIYQKNPVIIKTLISEAPLQKVKNVFTTTIEKLLVDIFCDKELYFAFQGKELRTITEEAFMKYSVNQNKILRYANRRGKKEEFVQYLKHIQIIGNNV